MPLTIYKSSAGSGKTYTLVKEYLKIVLQNPFDYKHILAITFTNKATEEMKVRIIDTLEEVVSAKADMYENLLKEIPLSEEQIRYNAQKTLDLILHDYSRFEVSTIDSFFSKVIRSFAKELQLPLRYDMEMDTQTAINEAASFMFARLHENKPLARWLMQYAFSRMDDDKGWRIEGQLQELGKTIFDEEVYEWLQESELDLNELNDYIKVCRKFVLDFDKFLLEQSKNFKELLKQNSLSSSDLASGVCSWLLKYIPAKDYQTTTKGFITAIEESKWKKSKDKTDGLVDILTPQLDEIAQTAYNFFKENELEYYSYKVFLTHVYAYGVLGHLSDGVKAYRDENNLLLISDINAIITSAIGNNDAPFLYEKLGSYYKHIFIDEFQDTSNFQWNNLKPLVYNSLGEGEDVLIVGDVKQSIYRFRGGNLNLLLKEVKNEFQQRFNDQISEEKLESNWRSKRQIVDFNNKFFLKLNQLIAQNFEENTDNELIKLAYENIKQKVQVKGSGYVEVRFFKDERATSTSEKVSWRDKAKLQTLETLKRLKEQGYTWNDIMLLVFRNKDANELSDLLIQHDIPFISSHSLLAASSLKVKFLVQIMYHLQRPDDQIAYAAMLHLYLRIKEKKIINYHWIFTDYGKERPIIKDVFPEAFFIKYEALQRLSVYELLEELCCIFGLDLSTDAYLQYFANLCLKQTSKGVVTIHEFLIYWEENKHKKYIDTPENLDAVTIMTIHKAKGLEKPVVILPFMVKQTRKNQLFWTNKLPDSFARFGYLPLPYTKELKHSLFTEAYYHEKLNKVLDELNKVYVAFTRPKEQLFIFTKSLPKSKNEEFDNINEWLHFTLQSIPEFQESYNQNEGVFCVGNPAIKAKEKYNQEEAKLLNISARPYNDFINIRSEAEQHFMLFDSDIEANISQGLKAHAVLEQLHQKDDLDRVLSKLLSEGLLIPEDLEYLKPIINRLFDNPLFLSWFEDKTWTVLAERELLEGSNQIHKPDRVLIKNKEAVVIDYKKLVEDEKYIYQIRRYGKVLRKMGYSPVRMYLVYVDTGIIKEIKA